MKKHPLANTFMLQYNDSISLTAISKCTYGLKAE